MTDEKSEQVLRASGGEPAAGNTISYIRPQARKLHDPDVSFEEYHFYAERTRKEQDGMIPPKSQWLRLLGGKKSANDETELRQAAVNLADPKLRLTVTDEEWTNASRAFRTASWGASFYLITTDVLGPYAVPFAIGTLGYGPGVALFTVFGFLAGYSGYLLWRVYLGVDSFEFPVRNYGDLPFRVCGPITRHITNFIQALSLLLLLGQVVILFGQNISQMSKFKLCYAVCPLLFVIAGFILTQVRTLKSYGWFASLAVWLNLLVIFITMGVMANSPPNYSVATLGSSGSAVDIDSITPDKNGVYPPIFHYAGLPAENLVGSINGLLSGVLAYSGLQLFVEFMAEMRRPRDFLKALWTAQLFIYVVYVVYGCYVYHFQGQYTFNPSFQGVSTYGWQTVGNSISLISGLIAAGLYGNIGIKVFYNNVLMDMFKAPPLTAKPGKLFYAALVPVWWSTAFVIAAAIPDYFGFISVISASTLLNMTYTLPPLLALAYDIRRCAMQVDQGEGFDGNTGIVTRNVTGVRRFVRGFLSGGIWQIAINVWHLIYFLASLAMCVLGMYAAVDGMVEAFKNPQLNSFSCVSPLNLAAQTSS